MVTSIEVQKFNRGENRTMREAVEGGQVCHEVKNQLHDLGGGSSEDRLEVAEPHGSEESKVNPDGENILNRCDRAANMCPHRGKIVNGVAYCGICANVADDVAHFDLFLFSLYNLCFWVAKSVWSRSVLLEDRQHHAFLAILTNIKTIIAARNRYAMAHLIAKRCLINLTERAINKNELPISQMAREGTDWAKLSNPDKLEILAGDEENAFAESGEPSRLTYFPGVRSLWRPQYLRQLEISLEKAFSKLPIRPVSQSVVIKLRFGMYPECGELNYEEIAKHFDLSERQARYQVQQGLLNLRRSVEKDAKQLVHRATLQR